MRVVLDHELRDLCFFLARDFSKERNGEINTGKTPVAVQILPERTMRSPPEVIPQYGRNRGAKLAVRFARTPMV